jgi:hypothetical protein
MKMSSGLFGRLAKYGSPAFLLYLPLVALYGTVSPSQPAQQVLAQYPEQTPIMVGFGYRARYSSTGDTTKVSRSYILLPMVLKHPKVITVLQVNGGASEVSESEYGFLFFIAWIVVCIAGTWWFWFREKTPNATEHVPHIHADYAHRRVA